MTTLPTLIQQLRAARPDSLTEIREAIAVVAECVDQLRQAAEDNARLAQYEARAGQWVTATASSCRDNGQGICTSCNTVHMMPNYSFVTFPPEPDDELRKLRGIINCQKTSLDYLLTERDAALADVERAERERAETVRLLADAQAAVVRLKTANNHIGERIDAIIVERDALAADVERLTAELAKGAAQRGWCPHYRDCETCEGVVSETRRLYDDALTDRDRLAAEVKTLTWQRDAARSTADELARVAETTERETVERIAAWLLTNVYDDVARNQIVEIMRRGDWRTK